PGEQPLPAGHWSSSEPNSHDARQICRPPPKPTQTEPAGHATVSSQYEVQYPPRFASQYESAPPAAQSASVSQRVPTLLGGGPASVPPSGNVASKTICASGSVMCDSPQPIASRTASG